MSALEIVDIKRGDRRLEEKSVPHGWSKLDVLTLQLALLLCDGAPKKFKHSEILEGLGIKRGKLDRRLRWLEAVGITAHDDIPHQAPGMPATYLHYWTGKIERSQVVERLQELGAPIEPNIRFEGIPRPGPDSLTVFMRTVRSDAARKITLALLCFTEGDGVTIKEIAANVGAKSPTVSGWLLRLFNAGYLVREQIAPTGYKTCEYKYRLSDNVSRQEIEAIASEYQIPIVPPLAARPPEGRIPDYRQEQVTVKIVPKEARKRSKSPNRLGPRTVAAVKQVEAQYGQQDFETLVGKVRHSKPEPLVLAPPRPPSVITMLIAKLPDFDPTWDNNAIAAWMKAYEALVTNTPRPALPNAPANDTLQEMADAIRLIAKKQVEANRQINELFKKLEIPKELQDASREMQRTSAEYADRKRQREAD